MQLKIISYSEYHLDNNWEINDFTLNQINLVVGKNSTGKTRTVTAINSLSKLLSEKGVLEFDNGNYNGSFLHDGKLITYELKYENKTIVSEILTIDGDIRLKRGENGQGEIYYASLDYRMDFKIPVNEIAASVRRDAIQHPFLEDLFNWGENLIFFQFGSKMGRENVMLVADKDKKELIKLDYKNTERVVGVFSVGINQFQNLYSKRIISDMNEIGFEIEDIEVNKAENFHFSSGSLSSEFFKQPNMLIIKEKGVSSPLNQFTLSQGMFRSLSLIIQLNYFLLLDKPGTILIDDIGEGLDYERASALIKLLIRKASNSKIQLIMTSNDRFIMNNVPLEYWTILERVGGNVICYNYQNSKEIFDKFDYTGLNNFDFFSSKYYLKKNNS